MNLPPLRDLWDRPGLYEPGSPGAFLSDLNPIIGWVQYILTLGWVLWRLLRRRDSPRLLHIGAHSAYCTGELLAELRRLHIDACPVAMTNAGYTVLVGSTQRRWADYVLRRFLAGSPVPAWQRRPA